MVSGYGGTYRGVVMDNNDPGMGSRLLVFVPDVSSETSWASPAFTQSSTSVPSIGEEVTVSYEGGDSDHPVWQPLNGSEMGQQPSGGYSGMYRSTVLDNADPADAGRLQVMIPEVLGDTPTWASPSYEMQGATAPEVGTEVWVQFEGGDPDHPVWVGVT